MLPSPPFPSMVILFGYSTNNSYTNFLPCRRHVNSTAETVNLPLWQIYTDFPLSTRLWKLLCVTVSGIVHYVIDIWLHQALSFYRKRSKFGHGGYIYILDQTLWQTYMFKNTYRSACTYIHTFSLTHIGIVANMGIVANSFTHILLDWQSY